MKLFRTLQSKVLIAIILVVMVVASFSMGIIFFQTSNIIKDEAINFMSINMASLNQRIIEMYNNILSLIIKISTNNGVIKECTVRYDIVSYDEFVQKKNIETMLSNYFINEDFIKDILIVCPDGKTFQTREYVTTIAEGKAYFDFCMDNQQYMFLKYEDEVLFFRAANVGNETVAYCIFVIDMDMVSSLFESFRIPDSLLFSTFPDGTFFSGNTSLSDEVVSFFFKNGNSDGAHLEYGRQDYFVMKNSLSDVGGGLCTIGVVPYRTLIVDAMHVLYVVLIVFIISIMLAVGISWVISHALLRNLNTLKISMLRIMQGNLDERAELPEEDEIREISIIFNSMMDKIDRLMQENTNKELEKQILMQDYLKMQIKPHFIYNTINTIKFVAHKHGYEDIEKVSFAVVELLRAAIGKNSEEISFEQEMEYCRQYVLLQNFRLNSNYELKEEIDPAIWQCKVPILCLQPIVENAILHGFENKDDGVILVKAFLCDGMVHVQIEDNGVGIDLEPYEGMKFSGVGVANVLQRMKLYYGDSFSSKIESSVEEGTLVEFIFAYV